MEEVVEKIEKKFLKGNTVVESGGGLFKLGSNEPNLKLWKYNLNTNTKYDQANVLIGYRCEALSGTYISVIMNDLNFKLEPDSFLSCDSFPLLANERIISEPSFEVKVWKNITNLINETREEEALVYLYETLIDELENITNCDSFLKFSIGIEMNSDIIVHILNALSSIKAKLKHWEEFKLYSIGILEQNVGQETAKILLNAIV